MQEPLIAALRRATSQQHAAIENLLRLGEPFERPHYHRVLIALEAFLRRWEPLLAAHLAAPWPAWAAARSRLPLLRRDMDMLGLAPWPDACCPGVADAAAAWGSLYVIEGSALGGQVVARTLERQHGIGPGNGGAYFSGWGARTGPMWREFQQALEREAGAPAGHASACAAAAATFDALGATFRMVQHEHAAA